MIITSLYDKNIFFLFDNQNEYKLLIEAKTIIFENYVSADLIQYAKKHFGISKHLIVSSLDTFLDGTNEEKETVNSSRYPGVSWHKDNQTWYATIYEDKKVKYLGCSKDEIVANFIYQKALKKQYDKSKKSIRASNMAEAY